MIKQLTMKKNFIKLFSLLVLFGCNTKIKNKLWLDDFEYLKLELSKGYANLKFASEKEQIDLSNLNNIVKDKLKKAKTKTEAQEIIKTDFLKIFKDGHLRASITRSSSDKKDTDSNEFKNDIDSVAIGLKELGYVKYKAKNRILFDSLKGYHSMKKNKNPFKAGTIETKKGKIGVLRIASFANWRFWDIAYPIWSSLRKEYPDGCINGCGEMLQKVDAQLTSYLIERIIELQREKILALVINVSSNGGGSQWCQEVARLFTKKELKGAKTFVVKHALWKSIMDNNIEIINDDLENPNLNTDLKQKILGFKLSIQNGILPQLQNDCSSKVENIWRQNDLSCLELIENPYAHELPLGIMNHPQFLKSKTKTILNTSRYFPYKTGVYSGPLYIVQDRFSGSATEEFSSLLQSNDAAIIIGENSYGAGCGYNNGGIQIELPNIGLSVRMPDCVRFRKDGKNEIYSIEPDIKIDWKETDSPNRKGEMIIKSIVDFD